MIAATGAAQIAAIAGTTFEGGGGVGGGASAAATTAAAPAAQLTRNVNVTLVGDTANMDSVRDLIQRIQEENEDGAVLNLRTY